MGRLVRKVYSMIAQTLPDEHFMATVVALDVLDEPDSPVVIELARRAGLRCPPSQLQRQVDLELQRRWPAPAPGEYSNMSPYLLQVEDDRTKALWCRRGAASPPEEFIRDVVRLGGIFTPVHARALGADVVVVAGRKRRAALLTINQRRFLEWQDGGRQGRVKLFCTIPTIHLSVDLETCEDIVTTENVSRYSSSDTDLVFAAMRLAAGGLTVQAIAERLHRSTSAVDNYLSLRKLCDQGLDDLQRDRLPLRAAYALARVSQATQAEALRMTATAAPGRRGAAILDWLRPHLPELAGATKAPPRLVQQRRTWIERLGHEERDDARVARAVLMYLDGDKAALKEYPRLEATFELEAGDPP